MSTFRNRNIIVGITGGIAAYKLPGIIRQLKHAGANVRVVITRNARQFVTRTVLETVSGNSVHEKLFSKERRADTTHIELGAWADGILIAPASANFIGKLAGGIADDLLTTVVMARKCPLVVAPAMNTAMYANARVKENCTRLKQDGVFFVEPGIGWLVCGEEGPGRLADEDVLLKNLSDVLAATSSQDLIGKNILISTGRTEEALDPVRILTNRSSGKMGYAIAAAARDRGAQVTVVAGRTDVAAPYGVQLIRATTVDSMQQALQTALTDADILVMCAAVSDYRPITVSSEKIKKGSPKITIELEATSDILMGLADKKGDRLFAGFAVETGNEYEAATEKLKRKKLDIIAVNNPLQKGAGFRGDTNQLMLIDRNGKSEKLPLLSKRASADKLLNHIVTLLP